MIDFTEIPSDQSEIWELFARDFLIERGFFIESPPDRGPDQKKDILVTERVRGRLGKYEMKWLVSCKHFAGRGAAVKESDEPNIRERLEHFEAEGFLGFYSTIASSGLNARLLALKQKRKIKDYFIFDHRLIENALITTGYSELMMRYFPSSYRKLKPLHLITSEYMPLNCAICGKDLLKRLSKHPRSAILVHAFPRNRIDGKNTFKEVVCVCKGKCDEAYESGASGRGVQTAWAELGDLIIPIEFLRYLFATTNRIRDGNDEYTDEAYAQEQGILLALAQKTLRATTDREKERFLQLQGLPFG
jgi:hypothetical protein